jgi:hypothetical protein
MWFVSLPRAQGYTPYLSAEAQGDPEAVAAVVALYRLEAVAEVGAAEVEAPAAGLRAAVAEQPASATVSSGPPKPSVRLPRIPSAVPRTNCRCGFRQRQVSGRTRPPAGH